MKQLEARPTSAECDLYFVIAGDLVKDLSLWDDGAKMKEEINFLILNRIGFEIKPMDLPRKYKMVEGAIGSSLSSTELRRRVKAADKEKDEYLGIYGLTTYGVIEMIK